jgi:hypothetical protein
MTRPFSCAALDKRRAPCELAGPLLCSGPVVGLREGSGIFYLRCSLVSAIIQPLARRVPARRQAPDATVRGLFYSLRPRASGRLMGDSPAGVAVFLMRFSLAAHLPRFRLTPGHASRVRTLCPRWLRLPGAFSFALRLRPRDNRFAGCMCGPYWTRPRSRSHSPGPLLLSKAACVRLAHGRPAGRRRGLFIGQLLPRKLSTVERDTRDLINGIEAKHDTPVLSLDTMSGGLHGESRTNSC